jgi:hypothetical protein
MRATKEQLTIRSEQHQEQGFRVRLMLDFLAGAVLAAPAGTPSRSAGSVVHNEELNNG